MEEVVFNPSKKPTVGIEIEAQLVDKDSGNLVNIAEGIIKTYDNDERVKHELYLSTVEVTSSPALDTNDTYKELSSIISKVLDIASENNAGLIPQEPTLLQCMRTKLLPMLIQDMKNLLTNMVGRFEDF